MVPVFVKLTPKLVNIPFARSIVTFPIETFPPPTPSASASKVRFKYAPGFPEVMSALREMSLAALSFNVAFVPR